MSEKKPPGKLARAKLTQKSAKQAAARPDIPARNLVDVRSEAATLLAGVDLREKTVLTDSFSAYCLAFSPDGKYLAAGQDLATASLWAPVRVTDLASGQTRFELLYPTKLLQFLSTGPAPDGAICLAFSADSKYLAVGTRSGQVHCGRFGGRGAHHPGCGTAARRSRLTFAGQHLPALCAG